jgi:hypothetical protein
MGEGGWRKEAEKAGKRFPRMGFQAFLMREAFL